MNIIKQYKNLASVGRTHHVSHGKRLCVLIPVVIVSILVAVGAFLGVLIKISQVSFAGTPPFGKNQFNLEFLALQVDCVLETGQVLSRSAMASVNTFANATVLEVSGDTGTPMVGS